MRKPFLIFLLVSAYLLTALFVQAQKKISFASPDKKITFSLQLTKSSPVYSVSYNNKKIIDGSPLVLQFDNGSFDKNLKINTPSFKDTTEQYDLVVGKAKHVTSHYRELTIPLQQLKFPFRQVNIKVRAFNEGIAFRYEFPKQDTASLTLLNENTSFKFVGNPQLHALFLPGYTSSQEGFYTKLNLNEVVPDTLMAMPVLFTLSDSIYAGVTEAALLNYAGAYLSKVNGILQTKLSPLPGQTGVKVKAGLPHVSPWRVLWISNRVGDLIESNMLTTLSPPLKIDSSWIHPGKCTFPWWNGNVLPDTINAPGNNFVTNKYYIDFCARNKIDYHSVVEYGLHQWYVDDGVGFQPGPHSDVTRAVPGLDMKEICDYAASVGVGIRVWVHWAALYPKLDSAFATFERWGLKGMMIDFMDRDDQQMVNIQTEMLEKAAKHHLHIQFHGAYKNTGLHRTYPNEYTREGTLNYETDKWDDKGLPPDHDINMPFTRMLAGSTDYHLGGFRAVSQSKYRVQYTRPLVLGTRCHMLAMYVVLENYLQMVCDYPEAYEGQPGFEFIMKVPTTWDETKVIDASVDNFITIARRKNNDWYVGTISNHSSREITVPLHFLSEGNYNATTYRDGDTEKDANSLIKEDKQVTNQSILTIKISAGGGQVIRLIKQ